MTNLSIPPLSNQALGLSGQGLFSCPEFAKAVDNVAVMCYTVGIIRNLTMSKPKPTILYHGRADWQDGKHIVTLSINGDRWEYALLPQQADTVEYLCHKISARKALAFCRSRSTRQVKV